MWEGVCSPIAVLQSAHLSLTHCYRRQVESSYRSSNILFLAKTAILRPWTGYDQANYYFEETIKPIEYFWPLQLRALVQLRRLFRKINFQGSEDERKKSVERLTRLAVVGNDWIVFESLAYSV